MTTAKIYRMSRAERAARRARIAKELGPHPTGEEVERCARLNRVCIEYVYKAVREYHAAGNDKQE